MQVEEPGWLARVGMNVSYQVTHGSFHDMRDGAEEEATGLEHSKILRGWTGKKRRKCCYRSSAKEIIGYSWLMLIKPHRLHLYGINIAHAASNVRSLALNWEIQQPGSTPVTEVGFLCSIRPPLLEKEVR